MQADAKKFMITISLCAMLAVNPVLATAPENDEDLGNVHEVYVESSLNKATNGIASVGYVNRMVDAAGGAATRAEEHAAAAGEYAIAAGESADAAQTAAGEAKEALSGKVNVAQGAGNKNKAMVTNADGTVYPGYISNDMISTSTINADRLNISGTLNGNPGVLMGAIVTDTFVDGSGNTHTSTGVALKWLGSQGLGVLVSSTGDLKWQSLSGNSLVVTDGSGNLTTLSGDGYFRSVRDTSGNLSFGFDELSFYDIAVEDSLTGDAVLMLKNGKFNYDVYSYGAYPNTVLTRMPDGTIGWQKVKTQNTDAVIGAVPVGSKDSTTYGAFWIE